MNSLMITPIGIGIIGIYSAVVGVALLWPLFRLLRNSRWKLWVVSIVGLPVLAAPWAEEAWIAWHFNEACKDAGVTVFRQVEVDGYADGTGQYDRKSIKTGPLFNDGSTRQLDFEKAGYRYYEDLLKDGGARHLEREEGQMMVTILDHPQARYHYKFLDPRQEIPIGRRLKKFGDQVIDSETNEVLGSDTRFVRYPNLAETLWLQYFGPAALSCSGPLDAPEKQKRTGLIYDYVLKSTKSH
ncbi:MAG TPA: hypothetical protein PKN34_07240 [Azospira sp.]|nr:hypothetical protein [Azospira sp.]